MKVYVGNLSFSTTDAELRTLFEGFGAVESATVVLDRDTGRSRGFGFVTFTEDEAADSAISKMDGAELDGRTIKVNEAHARTPRGGGGGGGGGGGRGGGGRRDRW